jgi:C4-type Zn-finger protein
MTSLSCPSCQSTLSGPFLVSTPADQDSNREKRQFVWCPSCSQRFWKWSGEADTVPWREWYSKYPIFDAEGVFTGGR